MEPLNYIIGILGFILSIIGTYFTYISFINPVKRFNWLLKHPDNWEKFIGIESYLYYYRHKKYPNFQLLINWNRPVVENFHEKWINNQFYLDNTNNASYYVVLEVNGMILDKELFVSLDGHRFFVPVPRSEIFKNKDQEFYYDNKQIKLAYIVGKGITEFTKINNIKIKP